MISTPLIASGTKAQGRVNALRTIDPVLCQLAPRPMHGRPARPTPHHSSPSCRVLSFCFLSLLRFAPWLSSLHLLSNPFLFESPLTHANLDLAVDSIVDCLVECFAPSHLTPHTALASSSVCCKFSLPLPGTQPLAFAPQVCCLLSACATMSLVPSLSPTALDQLSHLCCVQIFFLAAD